jgi:single-strand DNA-binding protein
MKDLNKAVLIGRLTRDSEFKNTTTGTAVVNFSLAVNEDQKNGSGQYEKMTSFFDVVLFGKLAEAVAKYLVKGAQVCVAGKLKQDRWTDKATGQARTKIQIVCEDLQLIGGKAGDKQQTLDVPVDDPWRQ